MTFQSEKLQGRAKALSAEAGRRALRGALFGAACLLSPQAAAQEEAAEAEATAACVEAFDVKRTWSGAAEVRISSSCRKDGAPVDLMIDDYAFSAAFDAQGQAHAVVPLLGRLTLLNWRDAEGGPRAELIDFPDYEGSIQIALIWPGEADLELTLRETPGFLKTPDAQTEIGPNQPNLDFAHGYGRMILADEGASGGGSGFGHHAQVYVLEASRNPVLRGQRARARVEPKVTADLEGEARKLACRALAETDERFHFTIHVNLYGVGRVERQALAERACDPEAPPEARAMWADPVDFSAER